MLLLLPLKSPLSAVLLLQLENCILNANNLHFSSHHFLDKWTHFLTHINFYGLKEFSSCCWHRLFLTFYHFIAYFGVKQSLRRVGSRKWNFLTIFESNSVFFFLTSLTSFALRPKWPFGIKKKVQWTCKFNFLSLEWPCQKLMQKISNYKFQEKLSLVK